MNHTRKRGRPPVDTEMVRARLSREMLDAIDIFSRAKFGRVDRADALRLILEGWMISGFDAGDEGIMAIDDFFACDNVLAV